MLNTLSAGVLVAGIQKYFLANWQTCRELTSCSFHCRGSVSLSAGGALIASVTHSPVLAINFFLSWKKLTRIFFSLLYLFCLHLLQLLHVAAQRELWHCSQTACDCALNVAALIRTVVHCLFVILQSSIVVLICHFSLKPSPGLSAAMLSHRWSTNISRGTLRPAVHSIWNQTYTFSD